MPYPIVMVKFLDNALVTESDLLDIDVVCYAFGILVDETENYYNIYSAMYGDLSVADVHKVLKKSVIELKELGQVEVFDDLL